MKKKYQSKIDYSKKYNANLSTFQIKKELHAKVKEHCVSKGIKVRDFLESLISQSLDNL